MTLENVLLEPTLDTVKGILILDNDGKRILAKYVQPFISKSFHVEMDAMQVL